MKNITMDQVRATADPFKEIGRCIDEAMTLSIEHRVDVILIHNDREYLVCYRSMLASVGEGAL